MSPRLPPAPYLGTNCQNWVLLMTTDPFLAPQTRSQWTGPSGSRNHIGNKSSQFTLQVRVENNVNFTFVRFFSAMNCQISPQIRA